MILALILWTLALAAVPVSRRVTGDYFSPAAIVIGVWCGTYGLFSMRLLGYPALLMSTQLFILAAVALMVAGVMIGQRLAPAAGGPRVRIPRAPNLWVAAFSLLGIAGTVWYVMTVRAYMGPNAFDQPNEVRLALRQLPNGYLFLQFFCLAGPLLALALRLADVRLSAPTWILVVLCTLCTWITTDRTQFFLLTLTAFFMYVMRRGQSLRWRDLPVVVAVCTALLVANFVLVGAWLGKTPKNLGLTMQMPTASVVPPPLPRSSGTAAAGRPGTPSGPTATPPPQGRFMRALQKGSTLYLYATASYPALDALMQTPAERTYGVHVAYPIARLLQRAGLVSGELPPAIPAFLPIGLAGRPDMQFNGFTYLYYPLMDFGPAGALIYAAVIGVLSGLVYGWARQNRMAPLRLLLIGQIGTALMLSIFVNKFNNTASWYIAVLAAVPFLFGSDRMSPDR